VLNLHQRDLGHSWLYPRGTNCKPGRWGLKLSLVQCWDFLWRVSQASVSMLQE